MKQLATAAAALALSPVAIAPQPARAGLLDDFGSDPTKIAVPPKKEEVIVPKGPKKEVEIEPTLKGCKTNPRCFSCEFYGYYFAAQARNFSSTNSVFFWFFLVFFTNFCVFPAK